MTPAVLTRRGYALAAAGFGLFTVYGSFVPFRFVYRPLPDALAAFGWVLENRVRIQSRSDWAANVLLGGPVAFCLLAAVCVDRRPGVASLGRAVAVVTGCAGFAAAVEFGQLYFPGRTCSASDIVAQTVGSAAGVLAWVGFGQPLTDAGRRAWADPRAGGAAGQLLAGYALFVLLVQLLPLDITSSPADLARRVRDGHATLVPFADIPAGAEWARAQHELEVFGLFVPAGLVLGLVPAAAGRPRLVAGLGLAAALATEAGQLVVSRHPSAADVLAGGLGLFAGWAAVRYFNGLVWPLAAGWLAVLAVTHWQPFAVAPSAGPVEWVPFADAQAANYLGSLDRVLGRAALFVPVGVLAAGAGRRPGAAGAVAGLVTAAVLGAGQLFLPDRTAATTELVTGAAGACAGATAAGRLRPTQGGRV